MGEWFVIIRKDLFQDPPMHSAMKIVEGSLEAQQEVQRLRDEAYNAKRDCSYFHVPLVGKAYSSFAAKQELEELRRAAKVTVERLREKADGIGISRVEAAELRKWAADLEAATDQALGEPKE